MAMLIVLAGIPSSLKSDYALMLSKEIGGIVLSSGAVRREKGWHSERNVFDELNRRVAAELRDGNDCILDSTNISSSNRINLLRKLAAELNGIPIYKVCVVMATPYWVCQLINKMRGSRVPEDAMEYAYHHWQTPAYWEGWDEIWFNYQLPDWIGSNNTPDDFVQDALSYDLEAEGHVHALGGHCNSVYNHVNGFLDSRGRYAENETRDSSLLAAALLHDCGKPIVKCYDENGNALYYNHANVGAYESMFFKYEPSVDPVYVSDLITYHMDPFDWNENAKSRGAAMQRWGCQFLEDIEILHGADVKGKTT